MFENLDTLHNCIVYPIVSVQLEENIITGDARRLAESLDIKESSGKLSLPSIISKNIQSCLLDSCNSESKCTPPQGFPKSSLVDMTGNASYGTANTPAYFDPCKYITAPVTQDVGGIGVSGKSVRPSRKTAYL